MSDRPVQKRSPQEPPGTGSTSPSSSGDEINLIVTTVDEPSNSQEGTVTSTHVSSRASSPNRSLLEEITTRNSSEDSAAVAANSGAPGLEAKLLPFTVDGADNNASTVAVDLNQTTASDDDEEPSAPSAPKAESAVAPVPGATSATSSDSVDNVADAVKVDTSGADKAVALNDDAGDDDDDDDDDDDEGEYEEEEEEGVSASRKRPGLLEYDISKMYPEIGLLVKTKRRDWNYRSPDFIRAIWLEHKTNIVSDWRQLHSKFDLSAGPHIPLKDSHASSLRREHLIGKEKERSWYEMYVAPGQDPPVYEKMELPTNTTMEVRYNLVRDNPPIPSSYVEHYSKFKKPPFNLYKPTRCYAR